MKSTAPSRPAPRTALSPTPIRPHGTAPHRDRGPHPPHPIAVLGLRPAVLIHRQTNRVLRACTRFARCRPRTTMARHEATPSDKPRPTSHALTSVRTDASARRVEDVVYCRFHGAPTDSDRFKPVGENPDVVAVSFDLFG